MGNVIYPQFKCLSTKLNSCLNGVKGPSLAWKGRMQIQNCGNQALVVLTCFPALNNMVRVLIC